MFFSEVDCISCFQMQLIIECFDNVQTSVFFAKSGGKINNHLYFTAYPFDTICHACCLVEFDLVHPVAEKISCVASRCVQVQGTSVG